MRGIQDFLPGRSAALGTHSRRLLPSIAMSALAPSQTFAADGGSPCPPKPSFPYLALVPRQADLRLTGARNLNMFDWHRRFF